MYLAGGNVWVFLKQLRQKDSTMALLLSRDDVASLLNLYGMEIDTVATGSGVDFPF